MLPIGSSNFNPIPSQEISLPPINEIKTPTLSPQFSKDFGPNGEQTAKKMLEIIKKNFGKCQLVYAEDAKTFVILNSKEISLEAIQQVFSEHSYTIWQPEVGREPDSQGNKTVKLVIVPCSKLTGSSSYEDWEEDEDLLARDRW